MKDNVGVNIPDDFPPKMPSFQPRVEIVALQVIFTQRS
jgi:hypothetical protein